MSHKIIISGDREWTGPELEHRLRTLFSILPKDYEIIHGACKGVDLTAEKIAQECGFKTKAFPADWNKYGRAAGPIRNSQMLKENPITVYLFHQHFERSKGTRSMYELAKKARIPTYLVS